MELTEQLRILELRLGETNPGILPYLQTGLKQEQVASLTRKLPFELPLEYQRLYSA